MSAENVAMLFENYIYGMTRDAVIAKSGAIPCPDAPNNALLLCAPARVKFLGLEWRESFWFNNLDELQQVVLEASSISAANLDDVENKMRGAAWEPVYLETANAAFDMLEHRKGPDIEKIFAAMREFEARRDPNGDLSVYYFPLDYFQKVAGKIKSWSIAVDEARENLVVAQLVIEPAKLEIFFTAPLLSRKNALRYGEMIKRK